jgi:CIC family chloride channel protein
MRWFREIIFFLATAFIGLGAGLAAVGFEYGAGWIFQHGIKAAAHLPFGEFACIVLILTTGGALIVGWLMQRFAPDAPGSGIPQVKEAYETGQYNFSWNLLWVKFFGGFLSIGSGSSLGREGPTVHIGAAIASKVARSVKESGDARANALCAGAAAGLAAAFNSPLAGVTLVLEEVAEGNNMNKYAGRSLLASAVAVSMIYLMVSDTAALPIQEDLPMRHIVFWLSPLVAIFAGLVGIFFQWATLSLRAWYKRSSLPLWLRPATGALMGGIFCIIAFALTSRLGAFSLGDLDLRAALDNEIFWHAAAWLLAAKLLATIFCYGAGGCGGIFAPLIFLGGMAGVVVYGVIAEWFHLGPIEQTLFSLIGMTACLGAVVRAPLTSILIVIEMTRQVHVLPALMVAGVIGVFINTLFFKRNFYGETLRQDKVHLPSAP